jgi:ElaB/YqjD/DUF883 family membrane-anchored ribosome-binding protein
MMSPDQHRMNIYRQKERVVFDLKDLIAGSEELLRSTASYTGAEVDAARTKLQAQLGMARNAAGDWNQAAVEQYRRVSAATTGFVHDRPWSLVGAALVAGVVLGYCLQGEKPRHR